MNKAALAGKHLILQLRWVNRLLHDAAQQQRERAAQLHHPELTGHCITDSEVAQLLRQINSQPCYLNPDAIYLNADELAMESELRNRMQQAGASLPLDAMRRELGLNEFEMRAVLLCLAPEVHSAYGRLFAYIQDQLYYQAPSIGLLCSLLAQNQQQWLSNQRYLAPTGRLRRLGLLQTQNPGDTCAEQQHLCRPAPGLFAALQDAPEHFWRSRFYDPDEVALNPVDFSCFADASELKLAAQALRQGAVDLLAIWGEESAGVTEAVHSLAAASGKPLRRLPEQRQQLGNALHRAIELDALLWIDSEQLQAIDSYSGESVAPGEHLGLDAELLRHLQHSQLRLIISGRYPWRPTDLLARRRYSEVRLSVPDQAMRAQNWRQDMPDLDEALALELAMQFSLPPHAQQAAKRAAGIAASLRSNGTVHNRAQELSTMCRVVSQRRASRFTNLVTPKRSAEELVLSDELHTQVMEVAHFYKRLYQVNQDWGFGRLATGKGGLKALFTGDSGTGKTLAAEVIAGSIGIPLLMIDLSQLVSKWVGETEKNIDAAFSEAQSCNAMLFFDEADTLFGKRGEIQQGSDRYANLEVGYLLQRLEQFPGLVVLASNLKDEIDDAFTRRFQVLLHFPRPLPEQRSRLWRMAFPQHAPLQPGLDLSTLAHLDLTGAGIFNACHTAALLAAHQGSEYIDYGHIIAGISRQYHRESRVLGPSELKHFAQQSGAVLN